MTGGATPDHLARGATLAERRVRARNLFREAANRIHDDAVARQYGYAGALVAGVTIYGYLSQLAVAAWGLDWLRRGMGTVRFLRPVYDGEELAVKTENGFNEQFDIFAGDGFVRRGEGSYRSTCYPSTF